MGLIKAAKDAIGSTLHDQWKDFISCENMTNDVLMVRKTTDTGVITAKSLIVVAPGQMAVVYDTGKILDATFEPGQYTFDESSSPSFFSGSFKGPFKEMWQRFTYGGATAKEQAVYFFNMKEIFDNKFGTPAPVPYRDWGHPLFNRATNAYDMPMRVEVKCFGKYTFEIENPATFMSQVAGTAEKYTREMIVEQMRTEVIGAFSNVMNSLSEPEHKIEVLSLPNKTDEIKQIMDDEVFDKPIRDRGLRLVSFTIESLTLDDESSKKIDQYELGGDAYQQKGVLTDAYANAVQDAASNQAGAMNGFMGIGMMNMNTGGAFGQVNSNDQMNNQVNNVSTQAQTPEPVTNTNAEWKCACGVSNDGKFCKECGASKDKKCPKCETINEPGTKFCKECGEKL